MNDTKSAPDLDTPHGRLKAAREKAGFRSAEKAAKRVGMNPTTYRAHENGFRKFYFESATAYAAAFNVDAAYLLNGSTEGQAPERQAASTDALRAVMTEGARVAQLSELPPEYVADMMLEALEAYADEHVVTDPKEFARIHLGAAKRRFSAR